MHILIFEPHRGCKKVLLKKETPKINLGKTVRDGRRGSSGVSSTL